MTLYQLLRIVKSQNRKDALVRIKAKVNLAYVRVSLLNFLTILFRLLHF